MTTTEEIMSTHATNLRDEHQDARLAIPPRIRAIADLINKDKILEEEGDARYMVCADIAGACETVCTDALTEREAMSLLYDLGENLITRTCVQLSSETASSPLAIFCKCMWTRIGLETKRKETKQWTLWTWVSSSGYSCQH